MYILGTLCEVPKSLLFQMFFQTHYEIIQGQRRNQGDNEMGGKVKAKDMQNMQEDAKVKLEDMQDNAKVIPMVTCNGGNLGEMKGLMVEVKVEVRNSK